MGSAGGSCSQRIDETIYLAVLFAGRRSFEQQRALRVFVPGAIDGNFWFAVLFARKR
jgi:hypothetical protein